VEKDTNKIDELNRKRAARNHPDISPALNDPTSAVLASSRAKDGEGAWPF